MNQVASCDNNGDQAGDTNVFTYEDETYVIVDVADCDSEIHIVLEDNICVKIEEGECECVTQERSCTMYNSGSDEKRDPVDEEYD